MTGNGKHGKHTTYIFIVMTGGWCKYDIVLPTRSHIIVFFFNVSNKCQKHSYVLGKFHHDLTTTEPWIHG